jgi:hypothetical protein
LWHFDFTTIIDNFSTFFRRYVQPQKYFKKVENLTIYGPVFEFFGKKWSLSKNKIVFDVFEAFLRHFVFSTIIDNFSSFFRRYVQPRKYFRKVENLSICRPVDLILAKKPQYCSPCFPIQPPSTGVRNLKLQKNSSKSQCWCDIHVRYAICDKNCDMILVFQKNIAKMGVFLKNIFETQQTHMLERTLERSTQGSKNLKNSP